MKRYFAKPGTWFKEGTECFREEEMWPPGSLTDPDTGESHGSAMYRGTYVVGSCTDFADEPGYDDFWYKKGFKRGDEVEMRENCSDDEFEVRDD